MGDEQRDQPAGPWQDAAERLADGVRQTVEFQRKLVGSATKPIELTAAYSRFLRSDLAGYGQRIAELTVDYYKSLAEAARDYGDRFWEDVESQANPTTQTTQTTHTEVPRHLLEVSGPEGGEVTSTFTIENTDPNAADVGIEVGLGHSPDGAAFTAPVTVEPDQLTIKSGGSASVTIKTHINPDLFSPGVEYRIPVHLDGPQPAVIDVRVRSTTGAPSAQKSKPNGFAVRCPKCDRTFARKTEDLRLRPHKTPSGEPCDERAGRQTA